MCAVETEQQPLAEGTFAAPAQPSHGEDVTQQVPASRGTPVPHAAETSQLEATAAAAAATATAAAAAAGSDQVAPQHVQDAASSVSADEAAPLQGAAESSSGAATESMSSVDTPASAAGKPHLQETAAAEAEPTKIAAEAGEASNVVKVFEPRPFFVQQEVQNEEPTAGEERTFAPGRAGSAPVLDLDAFWGQSVDSPAASGAHSAGDDKAGSAAEELFPLDDSDGEVAQGKDLAFDAWAEQSTDMYSDDAAEVEPPAEPPAAAPGKKRGKLRAKQKRKSAAKAQDAGGSGSSDEYKPFVSEAAISAHYARKLRKWEAEHEDADLSPDRSRREEIDKPTEAGPEGD